MKQFLLASAAAMVMAGSAYAAEPLLEPLPPAPPIVEPFVVPTWAGAYVGADIGWGWADIGDDDDHLFKGKKGSLDGHDGFFNHDDDFDSFFNGKDDDGLSGPVGGVFAGWLGQRGSFLYGVELFAQIAEIDRGDDDHHDRRFDGIFDGEFSVNSDGQCFFAGKSIPCSFGQDLKVHALFGLEGMIGWGGDRAAFLLHAGPALGWFQDGDNGFLVPGARHHEIDETEFGLSVAAEGRFKLTERIFAGVIGRAFWFPDVGDDNDNGLFSSSSHSSSSISSIGGQSNDDDVTVFEVKARLGLMFGQPAVAAPPVQVAY